MKLTCNFIITKCFLIIMCFFLLVGCNRSTKHSVSDIFRIIDKINSNIVLFNSDSISSDKINGLKLFKVPVGLIAINKVNLIALEKLMDIDLNDKICAISNKGVESIYILKQDRLELIDADTSRINNSIRMFNSMQYKITISKSNIDSLLRFYSIYELCLLHSIINRKDSINKLKLATKIWNTVNQVQMKRYSEELLNVFNTINSYNKNNFLKFSKTRIDFGEITFDTTICHTIYFKNIGEKPTIINSISTDCSCTVPTYPKYPILPQKQDSINIIFKPKSVGVNSKEIIIRSLYNIPIHIKIHAIVR